MKYVMVTKLDNHWTDLQNTKYKAGMFKNGMNEEKLRDNTDTIFIKRDKNNKIVSTWEGKVSDICIIQNNMGDRSISFNVKLDNQIDCPDKYRNYGPGWYLENLEDDNNGSDGPANIFDPAFFDTLISTNNWKEFEKYVYYLIRCLGIHITHKFALQGQRGKADGFFRFKNVAVLYDCTLDTDFRNSKSEQIKNFCDRLRDGVITFDQQSQDIHNCYKSVWIITNSQNHSLIQRRDEITIVEVPIKKIIDLYRNRLNRNLDEGAFEGELRKLSMFQ